MTEINDIGYLVIFNYKNGSMGFLGMDDHSGGWAKKHTVKRYYNDIGYNSYVSWYREYDKWVHVTDYSIYNPTTIYMTEDGARQLAKELNDGTVVLL